MAKKYGFGLGDCIYTYYYRPECVLNEDRLVTSGIKKT